MRASKKYMFQKIKFLQSSKYFTMEARDQTEKSRKMVIQIVKENNIYIERNRKWRMKRLRKKRIMNRNNKLKKVQEWHHCCKVWKQRTQKFIKKLLVRMKIPKKMKTKMQVNFFKEECQSINSTMLVEISKSIKMINPQLVFVEKSSICLMSLKSHLIKTMQRKSLSKYACNIISRSSNL